MRLLSAVAMEPVRVAAALLRYVILNWPDTMFGQWMRRRYFTLRLASAGKNFFVQRGCDIGGYHLMHMGDYSGLGEDVVIALGPEDCHLRLGNHSFIGPGSYVRNMNHRFDRTDVPLLQQGYSGTDIVIGDHVWIGARCVLLAGASVGDYSVVAAGSVVSSVIPPFSVAGGNPARVVRRRTATPGPATEATS